MGECTACAYNLPTVITWGRYACECGRDYCAKHAGTHQEVTGHYLIDKQRLLSEIVKVLGERKK